jgi:hypothetical protein
MNNIHTVHYGMSGYLPQHSTAFSSRRAAEQYATSFVRDLREAGEHWSGSARQGWYECTAPHSLWYVSIETDSCESRATRDTKIDEINSSW